MNGTLRHDRWQRFRGSVTEFWIWLTNDDFDFVEVRSIEAAARPAAGDERAAEVADRKLENPLASEPGRN